MSKLLLSGMCGGGFGFLLAKLGFTAHMWQFWAWMIGFAVVFNLLMFWEKIQ